MKQRIEIRNFGPLKNVDLDISDYTLFIGPNASGKSTIAKLVHFFQTPIMRTTFFVQKYLHSSSTKFNEEDISLLSHSMAMSFAKLWDIQALQDDFSVSFFQNNEDANPDIVIKKIDKIFDVSIAKKFGEYLIICYVKELVNLHLNQ